MEDEVANTWRIDGATRSAMRLARAQNALSDEDFETAILEAEELLDEDPTHGPALRLLGAALLESGDAEGSAQALTQYLSLGDPSAGVFVDLATARFESCDLLGAIEAAQRALELDASAAEAHFYLGMALDRMLETEPPASVVNSRAAELVCLRISTAS
jgi:Flp pilus assembly protein TadD